MNERARPWLPWLLLALAAAATAAVYWPGIAGGWVFDDYPNIVDNAAIHISQGHSTLAAWVNSALSSPSSFLRRPLASLTFSLNWMMGNGSPWPFKVTNVVIHLINGVLLFCMLRALLQLAGWRQSRFSQASPSLPDGELGHTAFDPAAATRLALIVSTAWMVLPINLMAVLYVVQRMESLCQVFVLAGLWAYLHGRWMMLTARDKRRDHRGFALVVGGIVLGTSLGLMSKETAVLLPVLAFLAEWVILRFARATPAGHPLPGASEKQTRDARLWWTFVVTLFVPAVLGTAWLLRVALHPGSWVGRDFTLAQRLLTEARVLVDYLHWTLLPNPTVLSLYHDEIVISTGLLTPWTTLAAIVSLAALGVLAVWLRNRQPLISLGIGWFFAAQLLTATIVPLELVYEQRMYFASIGVLLAAGTWLLGLRWRIALPILRGFLVAIGLLWFALVTHLRAQDWSNPLRLAVAEATNHPDSERAVYEAGRQFLIASNYQPGKALDASWKYFLQAAAIPGASVSPDQALIMLVDHGQQGDDGALWDSMARKLLNQPTGQGDINALVTLTACYGKGICKFDAAQLQRAYLAALSRPHPIARLNGAYADFQRDILHDDMLAAKYLNLAVIGAPSEPAYRIDLAALYARAGQAAKAQEQIDALRHLNYAGRLDKQISELELLVRRNISATTLHQ
ncbi:hypothetical protein B0E52_17515 [Rhodanobacter sp. C06]|uniref:hypothetical protein n=1 Tax=Rhodanobacter sp. C06 TaxID=1945854 RepID=UPI00098789D5|nr:hypothetical protein [Rhodanobacter sp. C06]OOG36080.1 hypothetical protein B0E52_16820 [Rhodanobacter sp. C06]OOG36207.1 hypothetical protein B0E52_17515 [Rhodanobacter sp. C06]